MSEWHATPQMLARYATAPADLDDVTASSVEAHLIACDPCRRALAAAATPAGLVTTWAGIADRVDRPERSAAERVLGCFVPDHVARVVAATPALRLSWLAAVTAVVAATVVFARQADTTTPFLVLAPLVPLAGVAVSFGPSPDPAGEPALATPLYGAGLLMRRAGAVLLTSLAVLVVATLALPSLELRDAGWVPPAVGLTCAVLALSTWLSPFTATIAVAALWLAGLQMLAMGARASDGIADSALFDPAGQLAFAGLAVLAALALWARSAQLCNVEVR